MEMYFSLMDIEHRILDLLDYVRSLKEQTYCHDEQYGTEVLQEELEADWQEAFDHLVNDN